LNYTDCANPLTMAHLFSIEIQSFKIQQDGYPLDSGKPNI
jgi:hypothetical protein